MVFIPVEKRSKLISPVHPNLALERAYREKLQNLIAEMHKSVVFCLRAAYQAQPPVMAADDVYSDLIKEWQRIGNRWTKKINEAASTFSRYYTNNAKRRADFSMKSVLKRAGMTVDFELTPAMREILEATMQTQVGLIKSIGQQYLGEVEGLVMQSVQQGRDLKTLTEQLEHRYNLTQDRAAFIARDQNNKAFAAITRARQTEIGVKRARWVHSGAGKHPRPEHVAFSKGQLGGPYYDIDKGAFLESVWTWPGVEPNCRCISRAVIEGFNV